MITVLHLTPHLGGGVGKALSGLIVQACTAGVPVRHVIACLERPEKLQFVDLVRHQGGEVVVAPSRFDIDELVSSADIVQLEWWNHPATIECLCNMALQPIRLLVWCHVSGLHNPVIPSKLMDAAHRFLFTSPCSFEAKEVAGMSKASSRRFSVVSSGGGFSNLPQPSQDDTTPLSVGYFGSLNFAKLHPAYVDFLSSVDIPDFRVRLIGDLLNRDVLERQCAAAGRPRMLDFRGYTTDVATELRAINVMAYLLNPCHYGTAENALLEAMAMGIVPIVLDNPAERCIVEDRVTGLVVRSPGEFAKAVEWLERHPQERSSMGMRAAESVRERFSLKKMEESFRRHYEDLLQETKRPVPFQAVFGTTPEDWFLSCQREPERFEKSGEISLPTESMASFNLLEKTKGSVFHFHEYFPEAAGLKAWAGRLEASR